MVNKAREMVSAPKEVESTPDLVRAFYNEFIKAYALSNFNQSPDQKFMAEKANAYAKQLNYIPPEWIPRVFEVARLELSANPEIFHLNKAWKVYVSIERNEAKKDTALAKIGKYEKTTQEVHYDGMRAFWGAMQANGAVLPKEIQQKYKL